MKKRILSFLLALLLLAAFLACSSQEQENASQNPTADGENPAGQAEAEPEPDKFDYARQKYEEIAAADYDGADFGITSQAATGNSEKEIWVETLTGDVVNDAVFNRNLSINERFNCSIELTPGDVNGIIRQAVTSGDESY